MRISDWSSDVCSSDLSNWSPFMPDLSPHRRRLLAGGAAALVLVGVVGGGILSRSHAEREEAAIATANALPTVCVIHPQSAAAGTFTQIGRASSRASGCQ